MAAAAVDGMAPLTPPPPVDDDVNSDGADTTVALCTPRLLLPPPAWPLALPLPLPLPCCAAELTQEPVLLRELRLSECEVCDDVAPDVPAAVELEPPPTPPTPATSALLLPP